MFSVLNPIKLNINELYAENRYIWFTSDCHFNHDKDFIYQRYGLSSVAEYDEYLIDLWNQVVGPNDLVFDLGDFVFRDGTGSKAFSYLARLNGQHYLLWGNHNSGIKTVFKDQVHYPYTIMDKVHYLGHYAEVLIDHQGIVLCHYPILAWNDYSHGTWMLHGHNHGTFNDEQFGKIQDVGLDKFDHLVQFAELKSILDRRQIKQWDQHDEQTNPSYSW